MGRVIKFRAWNGSRFVEDYYNHNHFISITDGKLIQVQHDDVCVEVVVYGKPDQVTLQQFTGLTDKNGVEVYEGDIILDEEGYTSKIFYSEKDFMWCVSEIGGLCELIGNDFSVIGNIYQNPELMENKNE